MGLDLYIEPLQRTKEREEFYKRWTLEQIDDAKYYEELRVTFEESIEFYIDTNDNGELELLEKERKGRELSKYWNGFYWFAVRNMLGEKLDVDYAYIQFKKEKDILDNLQKTASNKSERLSLLTRMSACEMVKFRMEYVLNESTNLLILQEYENLELDYDFVASQRGIYICSDIGYDILNTLEYNGYDSFFSSIRT